MPDLGFDVEEANCAQTDPDLFFPVMGEEYKIPLAKDVCARCPVAEACLAYAVKYEDEYGIWAGTTPSERRHIRRKKIPLSVVLDKLQARQKELEKKDKYDRFKFWK